MSTPLHQRLASEFRTRIASGRWPEGESAPSEATLCEEFGTSRGPVRQALATLRAEGLIAGGRGRQPLVRRGSGATAASALGSLTAWAQSVGRDVGQRTVEQSRHAAGVELAERLQVDEGDPVVTIRRVRLLDGDPALIEEMHFVWSLGRRLMEWDPDSGSINAFLLDGGADLFASTHTLDAVAATDSDSELLSVPPGSPLLRVRRVTTDSAGDVVECAEDRYVPGYITITVENRLLAATRSRRKAS
ncbi:GntR family transcriptional regulator [Tsukamurella sp. 8F]|uniref:GntR family transcriptional regulator n=1 Tax=unclassified Tsukamurella TaxID=2633480 RepID=UPI0023B91660|nr:MULTISPECIES: GntR family transcriptional regulator [unclassified Tsukamurella]MDF0529288.1 GntR family transcriptional regulator [Tsukamurella sp. 8J]MDF0586875.1 GntR family transcriptional regulator [Tsukamurella sp. 8F]